jgi:hypothetical protein
MADPRTFELEEIVTRPGTYFSPQTEVVVVVDDSASMDVGAAGIPDDAAWVLVGDEVPIDEQARDELLDDFQVRHGGGAAALSAGDDIVDLDENAPPEADPLDDE